MTGSEAAPAAKKGGFSSWVVRLVPLWIKPNHITIFRIFCSFLILPVGLLGYDLGWVVLLGFIAGMSDLLDGAVARSRGEVSKLGAFLDPLGDKILALVIVILVWRGGWVNHWLILSMLITEIHSVAIPLLVICQRKKKGEKLFPAPQVQPNRWGKLKTGWFAGSLGLVLIGAWLGLDWLVLFGAANVWVALIMGLMAEWQYFQAYIKGAWR